MAMAFEFIPRKHKCTSIILIILLLEKFRQSCAALRLSPQEQTCHFVAFGETNILWQLK
jgi:hypothetical protein